MTRLASIAGVAAVATIILLSGCQTAVRVDLAKRLVGTWTTAEIAGTLEVPTAMQAQGLSATVDVTRTVTAVVTDGPRHHRGDITITVTTTPTEATVAAVLPGVVTTAAGTIYVRTTTDMQVEIASIANTPGAFVVPEHLEIGLVDVPLGATYELADDVLMVNSAVLSGLMVVAPGESLTLTR